MFTRRRDELIDLNHCSQVSAARFCPAVPQQDRHSGGEGGERQMHTGARGGDGGSPAPLGGVHTFWWVK